MWLLTRHDHVSAALRDPHLSTDLRHADLHHQPDSPGKNGGVPRALLLLDPPDHGRIRKLVTKAFTPRTVDRLRQRIEDLVEMLLAELAPTTPAQVELIEQFAYPLPVIVICELMGVPVKDRATFREWSRLIGISTDPDFLLTAEQRAATARGARQFAMYFAHLIATRRTSHGDDLLSELITVEEDGDRLSESELIVNGIFLVVSGHESTVNLIGNGMLALVNSPEQLSRLRHEPDLAANAIEELLRFDSPLQLSLRATRQDYRIGDVTIPAGAQVMPLLGAANRDPEVFPEPDTLDLGRPNARRHVAFGGGAHFCLGSSLARLVGEIAITTLVRRYPNMRLEGPPPARTATFTLRGLRELRLRLH